MSAQRYVVIMAGGSGERFWPLSRMERPKQLLRLTSQHCTMLEEAIQRIAPIVPVENILIVTSRVLRQAIVDAMPDLPARNVIAEPAKRNTAPCLALAAAIIRQREAEAGRAPAASMAVLTADHYIGDVEAFRADVTTALEEAEAHGTLVTLGIVPTRPETGYGYIRMADGERRRVMTVEAFREKPDLATALDYLRSRQYLWNSGMFFWTVDALATAMATSVPTIAAAIGPMADALATDREADLDAAFAALPDISIDYGVMEQATNVRVVPATFPWDDVGSWDALDRMQEQDAAANVVLGDVHVLDTASSIIVNASERRHVVTTLGVDGLVVVVTDEATMVCRKERAQDVKKIVAVLRDHGLTDVL